VELAMQEVTRDVAEEVEKSAKIRKKDKLACGAALLALLGFSAFGLLPVRAQSIATTRRPVKHLVTPAYPELAKKLNLTGTARIEVTISPDGTVKHTRVLGGHPVLATEAERAAEKSTFEPGPAETVEVIEFKF
jgi:TonB family protein